MVWDFGVGGSVAGVEEDDVEVWEHPCQCGQSYLLLHSRLRRYVVAKILRRGFNIS